MTRAPFAVREVGGVVALLAAVLLLMTPYYGPHRDELYFVSAGQHLAWGYADQPSFTPALAGLAHAIAPGSLTLLRLPSIAAVAALVVLTAQFVRLLGGGRAPQVLAATTIATSALTMAIGHRLTTATFDTLAWTAILVIVVQALVDDQPRLWLLAGLVAGIGLNNKHAVAFCLLGVLVGVALVRQTRHALRAPWPWLGGLIALVMWLPNLVWQGTHGWPVFDLSGDIAEEYAGLGGRIELVGQAFIMFSPLIGVVWIVGLVQLLRRPEWARARPAAVAFLAVLLVFLVTGGKGYYLAGLVPPLLAAGSIVVVERWPGRRAIVTAGVVLALSAVVAWPALVPVLPVRTYTASIYPHLDLDQLETVGWPDYVDQVRTVIDALPADQQRTAVAFTGNYGEAGALEWYDVGIPVYSGHNGWREWGPPPDGAGPVVVIHQGSPDDDFVGCDLATRLSNAEGADNEEVGAGVWVCDGPRGSWSAAWPHLVHYDA